MPNVQGLIAQRFAQLAEEAKKLPLLSRRGSHSQYADPEAFYAWSSSVLNALHGAFGKNSPYYERFHVEISRVDDNYVDERHLQACRGSS